MQIIINATGELQEVTEKIASRLINKGKAHPAQMGDMVKEISIVKFSKPKIKSRKKSKVKKYENKVTQEEESTSEQIPSW